MKHFRQRIRDKCARYPEPAPLSRSRENLANQYSPVNAAPTPTDPSARKQIGDLSMSLKID